MPRAGLKIPDSYDAPLELSSDSDASLRDLLSSPTFQKQVVIIEIASMTTAKCHQAKSAHPSRWRARQACQRVSLWSSQARSSSLSHGAQGPS